MNDNQASYFIKSLTGKYNWMQLNASVIACMYFYKWLCTDREKLLCLDTLQGVRKYVRERFKIEKSKRKITETTFKYILLFARMFQLMDSRLMIVYTSFRLAIEATESLESGKLCCTGFVIGVGNTTKNFVHPSTITTHASTVKTSRINASVMLQWLDAKQHFMQEQIRQNQFFVHAKLMSISNFNTLNFL